MKSILLLAAILLVSCATFEPVHPDGFAGFGSKFGTNDYRAVSPEGITWRIHSEEHKPKASLDFWKPALRKRMLEAGYRVVDSLSFDCSGTPGFGLELAAPLGQSDYSYFVGVVPSDDNLILIESAGPVQDFQKRKPEIHSTLGKLRLK